MSNEFLCPFCGSKELKVKREEVELKQNGEYGPIEDFCCTAQRTNAAYIKKNFHPDDAPDPEEVSKW